MDSSSYLICSVARNVGDIKSDRVITRYRLVLTALVSITIKLVMFPSRLSVAVAPGSV